MGVSPAVLQSAFEPKERMGFFWSGGQMLLHALGAEREGGS